tara:strand:- start:2406 stop:4469 length:2064 start_codon:yes stop_codon:yes gene_type:complete
MAIIPSSRGVVFYDPSHRLYKTANQSNANLTDQAYTMQDIIDTVNASTEQHLIPTDLINYSSVGEQYAPYTAVNAWKFISMVTPPSTYGGAPYTSQPTQMGVDYMAPMFKIKSITSSQVEVDPYDFGANGASVFGQTQDSQWSFSGSSAQFGNFSQALNNWYNAGNTTFSFTLDDGGTTYTYTDVPFEPGGGGTVMIFTDGVNPANADFPPGTYISTFGFGVQLTSLVAGGIDINSDIEISEEDEKAWMWKGGDGTWRWRVQAPVAIESGNPNIIYTNSVFNANNYNEVTRTFPTTTSASWLVEGGQMYTDTYWRYLLFGDASISSGGPFIKGDLRWGHLDVSLPGGTQGFGAGYTSPRFTVNATSQASAGYSGSGVELKTGYLLIPNKIKTYDNSESTPGAYLGADSNGDVRWITPETSGSGIIADKRQGFKFRLTNEEPGSPDFGQVRTPGTFVAYERQAASDFGWFEYGKQWTPAVDSGYDHWSGGLTLNMDVRVMLEESVKDIITAQGYGGIINNGFDIKSLDNWMLASHTLPLNLRVDNAGASPGNGLMKIQLVDEVSPNDPSADSLPSTVCVWFIDTTDTSSNMGGPVHHIVWAGQDTSYAKLMNSGAFYGDGHTHNFQGNTGDSKRKYALVFEDEAYSNMRCKYLKATGGRVVFEDLPTADPVSKGVLWNDAGDLKISLG